jgi:DNA polymerase III psi subunit
MSAAPQLAESERQRLLQTMGFDIWVRRGSEPLSAAAASPALVKPSTERVAGSVPRANESRAMQPTALRVAPRMDAVATAPAVVRPRAASVHGAQSVLLILEKRLHADAPFVKQLMRTLPGCMVCTPDTIARGAAKYALQLGVDATLPPDVLGVRSPTLEALQQSASARRALWWSIKPMLKALKG